MPRFTDKSHSRIHRPKRWFPFLCLLLGGAMAAASAQDSSGKVGWRERFPILAERNIFDPERRVMRDEPPPVRPPAPPRVEKFSLVGTLFYEGKSMGVFLGESDEHHGKRALNESIAGFSIVEINPDFILMKNENQEIKVDVGKELRRVGDGPWEVQESSGSYGSSRSSFRASASGSDASKSDSTPVPDGDADEILKQLMLRRQQELNQ